jgi:hypothetical protein
MSRQQLRGGTRHKKQALAWKLLGDQDYDHPPSLPFLWRAPQIRLSLGAHRKKSLPVALRQHTADRIWNCVRRGRSGTTPLAPVPTAEQHELLMLWDVADRED